jgi:sterol desaturase/sphingolipid hydroxylase (fatty acid hydroxylase superfamily)
MEYVLHRIALHRMRFFSPMHGMHHSAPLAFIGTPTWMSVSILCLTLLVPLWLCLGFSVADGFTVGVMLGYWWYGIVHHVIHHRAAKSSSAYFNGLRAWHMRHHYSPKSGNFGVTTRIWDHVFGTAISVRDKAAVSS